MIMYSNSEILEMYNLIKSQEGKNIIQDEMFKRLRRRAGNITQQEVQIRLDNALKELVLSYHYEHRIVNVYGISDPERDQNVLVVTEKFLKIINDNKKKGYGNFVIYSGPSGVGKGTMWECLMSRGSTFRRFLPYATRERRPMDRYKNNVRPGNKLFQILTNVLDKLDTLQKQKNVDERMNHLLNERPDLNDVQREELREILNVESLPQRSVSIKNLTNEITLQERISTNKSGDIIIFGEFSGVDKIFVTLPELEELDFVYKFPVQDYYQGFSWKEVKKAITGQEIVVLECTIHLGLKILKKYQNSKKITNVFVLPFTDEELKRRVAQLKNGMERDNYHEIG